MDNFAYFYIMKQTLFVRWLNLHIKIDHYYHSKVHYYVGEISKVYFVRTSLVQSIRTTFLSVSTQS